MDEDESKWEEVNTVVALYQGYTPEDADAEGAPSVRRGWAQAFPGPSPPDLRSAEGVVEALEADFPEDPDLLDGLEVIVETVYGGELKRVSYNLPRKGRPCGLAERGVGSAVKHDPFEFHCDHSSSSCDACSYSGV